MSKVTILFFSLISTACMTLRHVPNPPRGMVDLQPAASLDERKEQFDQHAFAAAKKTTTVTRTSQHGTRVNSYQDLSILAQDGNYYDLANYLPELHKAGIAKDVENPTKHYDAVNKYGIYYKGAWGMFWGIPLLAYMTLPDCGDRPGYLDEAYDEYSECTTSRMMRPVYAFFVGMAAGGALGYMGMKGQMKAGAPIRKAKGQATKNRAAWARAWNKKLMEKLSLQEAPSVTKGQ